MKQRISCLFFCFFATYVSSQPDCELHNGQDALDRYSACIKVLEAYKYYEFSGAYHKILDQALAIDSTYAYAYQLKSEAFLKSGDFISWKFLIDNAVKYEPLKYLPYRAAGRFLFFKDFKGTIVDIAEFQVISSEKAKDLPYEKYDLRFINALCHKALNNKEQSLKLMEDLLFQEAYWPKKYDILHLGILYYELGRYQDALNALLIHEKNFNIAETQFYLSKVYDELKNKEMSVYHINRAHQLYLKGEKMYNKYVSLIDQIFLDDILKGIR